MLATAGAGALLAWSGSPAVPVLICLGYAAAAVFALRLPDVAVPPAAAVGAGPFHTPAFRWALLATMLVQGSHAAYYAFAGIHWRSAGIGDTIIGLLIAEGIVAEIVLFRWGGAMVQRLGPAGLTALAALACLVRWTATAFTVDVGALAAIQLLHAATFAFQHLSTMLVLARMAPARAAVAQALMSAIGFSLATGVLVWVVGRLYGGWGGLVFLPMAGVGGLALLTVAPLRRTTR